MFDLELLDNADRFEVDSQAAHLFKHPHLGLADVRDGWANTPVFYPAKPPAHWLMVAEVHGRVAPSRVGDPRRCRPIGCYVAAEHLARRYREHR